jgi:DMSO/TMAO reductase YedYZ molybdopterin-dependent catalytic subunit
LKLYGDLSGMEKLLLNQDGHRLCFMIGEDLPPPNGIGVRLVHGGWGEGE